MKLSVTQRARMYAESSSLEEYCIKRDMMCPPWWQRAFDLVETRHKHKKLFRKLSREGAVVPLCSVLAGVSAAFAWPPAATEAAAAAAGLLSIAAQAAMMHVESEIFFAETMACKPHSSSI